MADKWRGIFGVSVLFSELKARQETRKMIGKVKGKRWILPNSAQHRSNLVPPSQNFISCIKLDVRVVTDGRKRKKYVVTSICLDSKTRKERELPVSFING
jgi:hypothetical protein